MEQYGIPENLFRTRTTVAFVWRYRAWGSAVKPIGQPSPEALVEKYSRVFRRLIDEFDCHVLITGMNPVSDDDELVTAWTRSMRALAWICRLNAAPTSGRDAIGWRTSIFSPAVLRRR